MHIYFLGICGTAMGNAALLLQETGTRVTGSDTGAYPPMSEVLQARGIEVLEGFDAARLAALAPNLVVVGNSVTRGNPEFEWLLEERKIPFVSLPALISEKLLAGRRSIVVTGTHGKTTTSALTAVLLRANGSDPGFFIGGVPRDLPTGASNGAPEGPFVIEGDEYDSALFDKRSKFIHYAPHIAIVNNIEFDHADIFRDLADVQRSFNHLLKLVPRNGYLLLNGDDPAVAALDPASWATTYRVGVGEGNDLVIQDFQENPSGSRFQLVWQGKPWGKVQWTTGGLYNARNAVMAALAAALSLYPTEVTRLELGALATYQGVKRRQERLFDQPQLTVIEDFGHHPTALKQALASFRQQFPGRKLTAVFEPRSNTSRRNVLQRELLEALQEADEAYLGPINRPEKVKDDERLDLPAVVAELQAGGTMAAHFAHNAALLETLVQNTLGPAQSPRTVVFFTNGSFDGIMTGYVTEAQKRS